MKVNNIINLLPHAITLVGADNSVLLTIPASGQLARCKASTVTTDSIEIGGVSIPETETVMGAVEGLPEEQEGTLLVVSLAVAKEVARVNPGRKDLRVTNESVRDADGTIIGCRSLGRV